MLVDVDGVNPAFRDKVIAMVEGITEPMTFKLSAEKGTSPQSVVFECSEEDPDKVVPFLKSFINHLCNLLNMFSGGNFRNHSTVQRMNINLGIYDIR